jgi:hypothetical protein
MQDAVSPARKRWFQFTLRDCLIATIAIAATIAPFKLYERFHPPANQVVLQAVVYEADAEELRELTSHWSDHQLRAASAADVARTVAELQKINANVKTSPTLNTIDGQEARVTTAASYPIQRQAKNGPEIVGMAETGLRLSITPKVLANRRIRCEMKWQHLRADESTKSESETLPAVYQERNNYQMVVPAIAMEEIDLPTELALGETIFFCDAGDGPNGKGTVVQVKFADAKSWSR